MTTLIEPLVAPVRVDEAGGLRVGETRVSLDSVVYAFREGLDAAEIRRQYDSLSLAEVHAAIAYYLQNKAKVDEYIAQRETERERRREENLNEFPNAPTHEMLLARKNGSAPDRHK